MTLHEFRAHVMKAHKSPELRANLIAVFREATDKLEKLGKAGKGIYDASRVATYGHDRFLPAAKDWRNYIKGRHSEISSERMKELRGRLGGTSRWLYARQKATFQSTLDLLLPCSPPEGVVDWAWDHIKSLERRLLADARKP